ncbi:MAG: hypothetical protein OEW44_02340 [Gemmatimonadota bacterium]|nr:hypothetical protein [Gemmatimonadota bacterium]
MSFDFTLRRWAAIIGAIVALVGMGSAIGSTLGFRYTGPAAQLTALALTDSMVMQQMRAVRDTLMLTRTEHLVIRDSMAKALRPMNLYICLRASAEDTALMDLDCDLLIGRARNAYLLRQRNANRWEARP